jgi:D-glycero-alpha-D-manno-heptose-7-phosphate kinase
LSRFSSDIEKTKIDNFKHHEVELRRMAEMVTEAMDILNAPDRYLLEFGKLLDEGWRYKKSLSDKVSMPVLDQIYDAALKAGAIGGKILGAGGGGFLLLFVPPENQLSVKEQLKDLINVPVRFEGAGSKIVLYQPDGLV